MAINSNSNSNVDGVAIIGMSGRFPGASNPDEFWQNLKEGVESISRFSIEELEIRDVAAQSSQDCYVRARAILEDADRFDADFFGIYPQEAKLMDPQHRIFLECCWEVVEDAGYDVAELSPSVGVFAGCSPNSYFLTQVCQDRNSALDYAASYQTGHYTTMLGAIADTLATRVAYKLNLRGPAVTLLSACSTSLVAVCQACSGLLTYQCDLALAGGASITFPQRRGYVYQAGGMSSPDGYCRTFDQNAQGTVFGSGVGVVLLKRYSDAIADGDSIYAVIKGFAVNNDGASKVGFAAPSVEGQASVIAMAQAMAGADPESITYIEAHGTGTPLGDPIEIAALTEVFRAGTSRTQFCALGTAKTNIGHLDVAAGVTGLIKTALSIKHRQIPAILHFEAPNPKLHLESSPFYVNRELVDWTVEDRPLRAGVSSFGVGGTNAHVVLEESICKPASGSDRPLQLLPISARSPEALAQVASRLAHHLASHPEIDLADAAYTLQRGRRHFACRAAVSAATTNAAVHLLTRLPIPVSRPVTERPVLHFLFPGQGTQYPLMGFELYRGELVFRRTVDLCAEILRPLLGEDLRDLLYPDQGTCPETRHRLNQTQFAQPALFATEYALAQLWMSWGLAPGGMVGHSVGEFVCACLAGVFSLEDALGLIAHRGLLMRDLPGGSMLSVRLPEPEVLAILYSGLSLAAVNAPALSVVSGPSEQIGAFEAMLSARGTACRRLHTSHAFHSSMMEPILAQFTGYVQQVPLKAPKIPYLSCVTGDWITDQQATDASYWATHFRSPVRFSDAVSRLCGDAENVLLEVGAGNTLQSLVRQQTAFSRKTQLAISSLPDASSRTERGDYASLLEAGASMWTAGIEFDWKNFSESANCRRVSLPTYPFARKRFWIGLEQTGDDDSRDIQPESAEMTVETAETKVINTLDQIVQTASESKTAKTHRVEALTDDLVILCQELSGMETSDLDPAATFLELGFDSLFLTQLAQSIHVRFGAKVTFRQLLAELDSIQALAVHLDRVLPGPPATEAAARPAVGPRRDQVQSTLAAGPRTTAPKSPILEGTVERLLKDQLEAMTQLMNQQLEFLRGASQSEVPQPAVPVLAPSPKVAAPPVPEDGQEGKAFNPFKPPQRTQPTPLSKAQELSIQSLIGRYAAKTAGSKVFTQKYRSILADPRAAAGFRAEWKEMIYPIVSKKSRGARLWDVDGNEYIDLLNGFGPIAFGHMPDFVRDAVLQQMEDGIEIGPQTPLAGEVAQLLCELTGMERATFCNTGSEAVMAAMRIARTVTGRKKIVMFAGDYHGNFDEVLAKKIGKAESSRCVPIAPGITPEAVANVIVLEYGTEESLEFIRRHANELAAVLVEPVQSRHPHLQPREFLKALREITTATGAALIFDEVVTGFRVHQGGAQALYGIRADLASYGKILGGGFPIGALAGKGAFMDALDGGAWNYGDDSFPEAGVTFFAGTFVRHPVAMAAARAVLRHIKEAGPSLQENLTARTTRLVNELNATMAHFGISSRIESCGSFFYFGAGQDFRYGSLLYYHLRLRGVHILEGFPCFLTTAHTDSDCQLVVRAFADSLAEMQSGDLLPVSSGAVQAAPAEPAEAPLTEPQLEVWLSSHLGPEAATAYNESISIRLEGRLDELSLRQSLEDVINRHQALRARLDPDRLVMTFQQNVQTPIPLLDLSRELDGERNSKLQEIIDQDARTPFDLTRGPVVRATLVRLDTESHTLLFTAHHIVCDGWSMNIVVEELGKTYSARVSHAIANLPKPLAFGIYAERQRTAPAPEQVEQYWLKRFSEPAPLLNLPLDHPRPSIKSFAGSTMRKRIGRAKYEKIKSAGARNGATLFTMLLAGFEALLSRLTGQDDIVIGIPSAAQSLLERETLVGHCVNFLAIRGRIDAGGEFLQLLSETKRAVLDAYDHQNYTYGTLVRSLGLKRDPSRLPLIEVQFNLERLAEAAHFDGLDVRVDSNPKRAVNFDLFFNVLESSDGLLIDCDYNTTLFEADTVERWLGYYENLLFAASADVRQSVAALPVLDNDERELLISGLNQTKCPYPHGRCIHELILEQTTRTPDAVAVIFNRQIFTYRELDRRTNQLAHYLIRHGVVQQSTVPICLDRSSLMLESVLAILKCGAIYLPLDPALPRERINFILEEAGAKVVLTNEAEAIRLSGVSARFICVDSEAAAISAESAGPVATSVSPLDLAYLMYTSGSTGKPKGVEISHRAVVNFLCSMRQKPGLIATDRLLAVTTLSFDIAGLEMFLPLVVGARVVIASREATTDGTQLAQLIRDAGITIMQATPASWRLLLEAGWTAKSQFKMLCGGEALPRTLADELLSGEGELWNMYGPTETTIWSSVLRLRPGSGPVPIGAPIANTQFYVVDTNGQPSPLGVPGELWIGGDGVAEGYFKRSQLTGDRFMLDPFLPDTGNRVYKTGDLVRRLQDGTLEFLGRLDQQVKIRGFRIELSEIESVLATHPDIADVVVVAPENHGTKRLVAYYTTVNGHVPETQTLKNFISDTLPGYMIPAAFVRLDGLPRTPNGKLNRGGLPPFDADTLHGTYSQKLPKAPLECKLASICAEVLGLARIGVDANLFEVGVDSIQIFRIVARANRAEIPVTAQQLFQNPTIESLASVLLLQDPCKQEITAGQVIKVSRDAYRVDKSREGQKNNN